MDNNYSTTNNITAEEIAKRSAYYKLKAKNERREIRKLGNILGLTLMCFTLFQFVAVFFLNIFGLYDTYMSSSVFQNCFSILGVHIFAVTLPFAIVAITNKNKFNDSIIPTQKVPFKDLCLWVGFGMFCCVGANYVVNFLITLFNVFGHELVQNEVAQPDSLLACFTALLSIAVVPAICEEFAMRCCSLGLLKKYGKSFGIFAVAIIFGLLHGNLIQFVFAGIIGLVLGYITLKTNSVVPAMLIHGLNNAIGSFNYIFAYLLGDKMNDNYVVYVFLFWIVIGAICTVILLKNKKFKSTDSNKMREPYANSTPKKLATFFFVPGMIVPFLFLISSTIESIH